MNDIIHEQCYSVIFAIKWTMS